MRIANLDGRAIIVLADDIGVDVELASSGQFGPDLRGVYDEWWAFLAWAGEADLSIGRRTIDRSLLGAPSPEPRQIFAIGLNYREHAEESGFEVPEGLPPVFTKFVSSITGPDTTVMLPLEGRTDWEVELVVVIGRETFQVPAIDAWAHIAGLTVGQDLSERVRQLAGPAPQFGLAKSFPGFAPLGPWLVTPEEFDDPDALTLGCRVDGEVVQSGSTKDLVVDVPNLVERLSAVVTLFPGDLIFTGTPAGVGQGRTPQRFLKAGEELVSWVEGIGELRQTFVSATPMIGSSAIG